MDGGRFDNRAERLVVIDVVLLRKTTNDPPCFVMGKKAINMVLVLEDPLASDHISTWWSRYKMPGAIVEERLVLVGHGRPPIRIRHSST